MRLLTAMLVAAVAMLMAAPAAAQDSAYADIDCRQSYIRAEGLKCQKGPEFKASDGTVRGNYYVARGNFDRVRSLGNLQWPADPGFVRMMQGGELQNYLKGYFPGFKKDGTDWSAMESDGDIHYLTFSLRSESCYVFRKYGPQKAGGAHWRIDGYLCAPSAQKIDAATAKSLIEKFQVVAKLG